MGSTPITLLKKAYSKFIYLTVNFRFTREPSFLNLPRWTSGLGRLKNRRFQYGSQQQCHISLVTEEVGGSNPSRGAKQQFVSWFNPFANKDAYSNLFIRMPNGQRRASCFFYRVSSVGRAVIKKGSRPGTTQQICSKSLISYGSVVRVHHAVQPPYNGTLLYTTI